MKSDGPRATLINDNFSYNEETQKFAFDAEVAITQGLDENVAYELESSYMKMSEEESAKLNDTLRNDPQSRGLIAGAAAALVAAGFAWLGDKLMDGGATAFCNAYRDYNSVTEGVCDFLQV